MSRVIMIGGHVKLERERAERYQGWRDQFARSGIEALVAALNHEVGNMGWVTARGDYLHALHRAFEASGYDCSAFISSDGRSMSLSHRLRVDGRRIVLLE